MRKAMSIQEVAKLVGVSKSTVSRVINGRPRVAPETARLVREAMRKLGYRPSPHRPGPKPNSGTGTATTIAFFMLGTSGQRATPAFESLLHGVSAGASEHGLNLLFSHLPDVSRLPAKFGSQRIDGLLLHGAAPEEEVRRELERLPTVWLMANRKKPTWGDQVMPDAYAIGEMAAQYLLGRGHKHLAFLNLDAEHWAFKRYRQAFVTVAEEMGAESGVTVVALERKAEPSEDYWHPISLESVEALVEEFLRLEPRPTGVFVADDMQVAMVQPALLARGVKVGAGGVEIVSCNNEQPFLVGLNPRPTEIDIRVEVIGRRGVDQLIWRMSHPGVAERITSMVEPKLVVAKAATEEGRMEPTVVVEGGWPRG